MSRTQNVAALSIALYAAGFALNYNANKWRVWYEGGEVCDHELQASVDAWVKRGEGNPHTIVAVALRERQEVA